MLPKQKKKKIHSTNRTHAASPQRVKTSWVSTAFFYNMRQLYKPEEALAKLQMGTVWITKDYNLQIRCSHKHHVHAGENISQDKIWG